MKVKISIVILILLSFFNIGAVSSSNIKSSSFSSMESACINKSQFIENGSKIQYKSKNSIDNEKNRIKEYIIDKFTVNYYDLENNETKFINDDMQIETDLWNDDKYTYVVTFNTNYNVALESLIYLQLMIRNGHVTDF